MNLRKALLDAAKHLFVPVDLEIWMQPALHQHASPAEFDCLANLFIDSVEVEDVAFLRGWPFQRTIKRTEGAIFGAEIGVVNIAVDDVGYGAFGMYFAAEGVGLHANPDEIIGLKHLQSLLFSQGHPLLRSKEYFSWCEVEDANLTMKGRASWPAHDGRGRPSLHYLNLV